MCIHVHAHVHVMQLSISVYVYSARLYYIIIHACTCTCTYIAYCTCILCSVHANIHGGVPVSCSWQRGCLVWPSPPPVECAHQQVGRGNPSRGGRHHSQPLAEHWQRGWRLTCCVECTCTYIHVPVICTCTCMFTCTVCVCVCMCVMCIMLVEL